MQRIRRFVERKREQREKIREEQNSIEFLLASKWEHKLAICTSRKWSQEAKTSPLTCVHPLTHVHHLLTFVHLYIAFPLNEHGWWRLVRKRYIAPLYCKVRPISLMTLYLSHVYGDVEIIICAYNVALLKTFARKTQWDKNLEMEKECNNFS